MARMMWGRAVWRFWASWMGVWETFPILMDLYRALASAKVRVLMDEIKIDIRARSLVLMHVRCRDSAFEFTFQVLPCETDRNGLPEHNVVSLAPYHLYKDSNRNTHFFALKNRLPNSLGSRGTTRSSAKNRPFSAKSILLASNGLNLPFNFSIPTTREMKLILCEARRSLYSR